MPTEGAPLGDTLGWVLLAAAVLVLGGLSLAAGALPRPRLGWTDLAVGVLCGGPLLSAGCNLGRGDDRALVCLTLEWLGLLGTWVALRLLAGEPGVQEGWRRLFMSAAFGLALLGIWQHHQGYVSAREEYRRLNDEQRELQAVIDQPAHPRRSAAARRLRELEHEFLSAGIPRDERGRMLWESRLEGSSEPVGRFALANTFAGLLLVGLLAWETAAASWFGPQEPSAVRGPPWADRLQKWLAAGVPLLVVGYCLLLTKSRTAWGGTLLGAALLLARQVSPKAGSQRSWPWRAMGVLAAGLAVLVALGTATGGLDRFIVSESFKSLRYRGEYWVGTWRMMWDPQAPWRWLIGVGPGNFRQCYLPWKLPQSSEEIADPHNLFLDQWANGGLLGLAGACSLWGLAIRRAIATSQTIAPQGLRTMQPELWGVLGACGVLLALTVDGETQVQLLGVGCGLLVGWWLTGAFPESSAIADPRPFLLLGLLTHLLAAGGIAMPAVVALILWLLAERPVAVDGGDQSTAPESNRLSGLLLALVGGLLAVATAQFGLTPVLECGSAVAAGDAQIANGSPERAVREYRRAANSDPSSPQPCERLAAVAQMQWQAGGEERDFEECLRWRRETIARNPGHAFGWRALGETWRLRFERTRDPGDAAEAVDALATAVSRHPTHSEIVAEWALAQSEAGQPEAARLTAQRVLDLDELNSRLGHVDKILPQAVSDSLRRMLDDPAGP